MISFRVTPDSGDEYVVTARSRDIVTWEKTHHGAALGNLAAAKRMTDLYALAYVASVRTGQFVGDEQTFMTTRDIEAIDDDDAPGEAKADPTSPAL